MSFALFLRQMGWLGWVLGAFGFLAHSIGSTDETSRQSIWIAEIRGTINPATVSYLEAAIRKAEQGQAQAVIVELDTPGGLVSSVQSMSQIIDQSQVPVIVFVTPAGASATSAGALLSLASHLAAMAPGTHIGAAHPVDAQGQDLGRAMKEKAVNDTAAFARGLAELRGRNRELAEQLVTKSRSLTAQEALKENLVELIVNDRSELVRLLDGRIIQLGHGQKTVLRTEGVQIHVLEMTWGQKILHALANPNIATLLITLGMLCLYVEITTPGLTVAGVLGGIMLLVAFVAFQMLPIRTGGLILMLLGIGMLIAELFVVSHGALALGGTISFILGALWILDPSESGLRISPAVWIPAALGMGGGALVVAVAAARTRRLGIQAREQMGGGAESGLSGYTGKIETVESPGNLGKVLVRGELWNFESDEPVQVGQKVQVDHVQGMRVRIRPVSDLEKKG